MQMIPFDARQVGRRVGDSLVFYWLKSLNNSSIITARQGRETSREAPTLLPSEAAILPGVADHLRAQVAREQARLLKMARSIEKASGTAVASVSISVGNRAENWQSSKESLSQFERGPERTPTKWVHF